MIHSGKASPIIKELEKIILAKGGEERGQVEARKNFWGGQTPSNAQKKKP